MNAPMRNRLAFAISLFCCGQAHAGPATIDLYVFEGTESLDGVSVRVGDDAPIAAGSNDGVRLTLGPGQRSISAWRSGERLAEIPLDVRDDESLQITLALYPQRAPVYRIVSSLSPERTIDLASTDSAQVRGRVVDQAGSPIAGADVMVNGATASTGTDGSFALRVRPGLYPVIATAAGFSTRSLPATTLKYGENTLPDIAMSVELAEAPVDDTPGTLAGVNVEAAVQTDEGGQFEAADERREAAQVGETISAEQISRAGDSDTAGALKRVTGLTVVGGKYIYVRGLGERYSSVLLNGAQIPSPDPTRRVVPLDLIPTDIISSVAVQKGYSADMPGEFAGGTVQLRTKGFPEQPMFRIAGSLNYIDGTSFSEGYGYDGGDRDWSGHDDGTRDLPGALDQLRERGVYLRRQSPANPNGFTPAQFEAVGEEISDVYDVDRRKIGPSGDLAVSGGRSWQITDDWKIGFLGSTRYSNVSDTYEETRRYFVASNAGLEQRDELSLRGTETEIDLSGFVAAGLEYGENHKLRAISTLIRQTTDDARETRGIQDNQPLEAYKLEWIENSLRVHQLGGEHRFPRLGDSRLEWLYTDAQARRYSPNTREYKFDLRDDQRIFNDRHSMVFADLDDDSESWNLGFTLPWQVSDGIDADLLLNAGSVDRQRDSYIRRYAFALRNLPQASLVVPSVEDIFTDGNIGPDGLQLEEITTPTDTYFATQTLDALAFSADVNFFERVRINAGLREEENDQQVTTFSVVNPNAPPLVGGIARKDRLPAISATWFATPDQQVRLGYSETVSRPDFRELSASPYLDPLLDIITFGNPDLEQTDIRNYDLRWEYYFSPLESFSVALFRKEFTNPVEKQLLPGSGSLLLTLANAEGATNQGVELDVYKELGFVADSWSETRWAQALKLDRLPWEDLFVAANYAWIDSMIELDPAQSGFNTNLNRPLEGQSAYSFNLQAGYRHPEGGREATLLYNVSGERIVQVGVDGQPDTYEQPFGQLDFTWKELLGAGWSVRLRLRNLLDPKVEYLQGGSAVTREYRKGRELALTLEWKPEL